MSQLLSSSVRPSSHWFRHLSLINRVLCRWKWCRTFGHGMLVQACHLLLASSSFPLFFTQRASRATFTSSRAYSLNSSSIFSSPLTSSPPHLTALHLCSSFLPAAGLGHPVWAVSIFFSLRLFSSSVLLSFFSFYVSFRSYPVLSRSLAPFFAQSPILCPFPLFFRFFFIPLTFIAYVKPEISASLAAVAQYVCMCVSFIIDTHTHTLAQ